VTSATGLNGCIVELGNYIFNLNGLKINTNESEDYSVSYNNGNGDVVIDFNICEFSFNTCPDLVNDFANEVNENGTCHHLSSDSLSNPVSTFISEDMPNMGMNLVYTGGDMCNDTSFYTFTMQLNCDEYLDTSTYTLDSQTILYPCSPKVIFQTPEACPSSSISMINDVFNIEDWLIAIPEMLIGLFLLVEGGKQIHVTLFLVPAIVASYGINCVLFITLLPDNFPTYLTKLWFFIGLILGLMFGVAMSSSPRSGILFMGTSLGIVLGFLIYYCFIIVLNSDSSDEYEFSSKNLWVTTLTSVFICASASLIFFDNAMIVSSAFYGAYIFVRGLAVLFGGFPSEFAIMQEFKSHTFSSESTAFFVYLIVILLLFIVSMLIQFKRRETH
jgi:hypothetical protein